LWQKGQFFIHISKRGLKALYYKALSLFLSTILSYMPTKIFFVIFNKDISVFLVSQQLKE
ncbi:hypothetical protein, partial [Gallibacterium anatis]|uniref:hypothetical protein n=1 Tax=Gallibacterium anatis TaxID=750 RepID=UPI003003C8D8